MNPGMGLLQHLHASTNQHQHQKLKWSKKAKKGVSVISVQWKNCHPVCLKQFLENKGRLLPHPWPATRGISTAKILLPGRLVISAGVNFPIKPLSSRTKCIKSWLRAHSWENWYSMILWTLFYSCRIYRELGYLDIGTCQQICENSEQWNNQENLISQDKQNYVEDATAAFKCAKSSKERLIARVCFSLSSVDKAHTDLVRKIKI